MHRSPENAGATFQVASQFNLLEMVSPDVMPEDGVTRYEYDRTRGPACAIAAGRMLNGNLSNKRPVLTGSVKKSVRLTGSIGSSYGNRKR
jgi:hypothetical protein